MSEKKPEAGRSPVITYTLEELCRAEKRMEARSDIIRAALMEKGIHEATAEQAKRIVQSFKERQVK